MVKKYLSNDLKIHTSNLLGLQKNKSVLLEVIRFWSTCIFS
jgi:hypothetical protein